MTYQTKWLWGLEAKLKHNALLGDFFSFIRGQLCLLGMKLGSRRDQLLPSSESSERGNDSIYIVPRPPPPKVKITILVPRGLVPS